MKLSNPISIKSEICSCFFVFVRGLQGTVASVIYTLFVVMKVCLSDLKYVLQQCFYKAIIT